MRKIYGMSIKDWKTLGKIFEKGKMPDGGYPKVFFLTMAQYVEKHPESVIERYTSKRGNAVIKVNIKGYIKTVEVSRMDTTCSYEID